MGITGADAQFYALAGVATLLLLGTVWYFRQQARQTRHQRHVERVIDRLGVDYHRDIVLPDGIDGLAFIDYLLLTPAGLIVLDVEHCRGHLFGGETVDQWSQVVDNKTYKFPNPLYANQTHCQAVLWNLSALHPGDGDANRERVHGWVVFDNAGDFPKGIPARVSSIDRLKADLAQWLNHPGPVDEQARADWKQLQQISLDARAEMG